MAVSNWNTAGYVNVQFKAYCSYDVYLMEHNFTGMRSGKVVKILSGQYCASSTNTLRTCYKTISIPDPSGSQSFQVLDEWRVWNTRFNTSPNVQGNTFSNVIYH